MTNPLVECIPNFSEARRPDVVDEIALAVTSVKDTHLLDRSSDLDHNRTVLTFAGPPDSIEESAFRAIKRASELIDLDQHTGAHPRIGATDVVPFVPLSGVTMDDCAAMARRVGERVGKELGIPVYLYEAAATRPDRVNLENIRRGQYEALKSEIETNPDRRPDYGPAKLGKAGATVIGARNPLIAFNAYLTTNEVDIAKKIAKAIRQSSGGMRYCKALGLLVEGRAQVSMNLTNYRETPVFRVVEMIRREAVRYGVALHHTELVGLIPQEALIDSAVWHMQLDGFAPEQVLESRLFSSSVESYESEDLHDNIERCDFVENLASPSPTPGGGSAAAFSGAMGAALAGMVAGLTIGKKKYADVDVEMKDILKHSEGLRLELMQTVEDDSVAFEAVMGAMKLPKNSEVEIAARTAAIEIATLNAAHVPLHVSKNALKAMALAVRCAEIGNLNAISDAASGAAMARAALTSAAYNVRINVNSLPDKNAGAHLLEELSTVESQAEALEQKLQAIMKTRGGLST
jgi:glutamate formiminotransferase / formiminotetrahydrofolate cyclodeaminase